MKLVVATHGDCFDGLASAVLFTRLAETLGRKVGNSALEASYRACGYGNGQTRADEKLLTGDANAILDYRYHPSDTLTLYFDHHRTAFASDADRADFESREKVGRFFFDAGC